jgi:hypothetical protein
MVATVAPGPVWNARLADDATVSPTTRVSVVKLSQQITEYGAWIKSKQQSVPAYLGPRDQRLVPSRLTSAAGGR